MAPSAAANAAPSAASDPAPRSTCCSPEQGDSVEHFAFGRSDVVKSDGDRLHLKVHKDGRIREIALGMLKVTRIPDDDAGRRHFKLERRM